MSKTFSPAEQAVLEALSAGAYTPARGLAARLGSSPAAVRQHIRSIRAKLGHHVVETAWRRGYRLASIPACKECGRPYRSSEPAPTAPQELSYAERAGMSLV